MNVFKSIIVLLLFISSCNFSQSQWEKIKKNGGGMPSYKEDAPTQWKEIPTKGDPFYFQVLIKALSGDEIEGDEAEKVFQKLLQDSILFYSEEGYVMQNSILADMMKQIMGTLFERIKFDIATGVKGIIVDKEKKKTFQFNNKVFITFDVGQESTVRVAINFVKQHAEFNHDSYPDIAIYADAMLQYSPNGKSKYVHIPLEEIISLD